jgi:DNA-directed RNA polymerase sigma subunit (sigma70/sigma32)
MAHARFIYDVSLDELAALVRSPDSPLDEREKAILTLRWNLDGGGVRTYKRISHTRLGDGRFIGVSIERIRQVESGALRKIGLEVVTMLRRIP